ncbi:MAG: hypothetical protein ABSH35_34830 [Isosphaeraceae bacterium]
MGAEIPQITLVAERIDTPADGPPVLDQVHVKGVTEVRRYQVYKQLLQLLMVHPIQRKTEPPVRRKPRENATAVSIDREDVSAERVHHDTVRALSLDLGKPTEESLELFVRPAPRGFEGAAAESLTQLSEGPEKAGCFLLGQAAGENQLFDLFSGGIDQVIPASESPLQYVIGLLIRALPCLAGKNDVDKLVGRVAFVAQIRSTVKDGHDPRDFSEETDAFVDECG